MSVAGVEEGNTATHVILFYAAALRPHGIPGKVYAVVLK